MTLYFIISIALLFVAVICAMLVEDTGGVSAIGVIFGIVLGLLVYQHATVTEVNCFRDGGQVVAGECREVGEVVGK